MLLGVIGMPTGGKGGKERLHPLEVNLGKAAWRSAPRAACPRWERMTCKEANHQESVPGLREELQLMNQRKTSHTSAWKAFSHGLGWGSPAAPVAVHSKGTRLGVAPSDTHHPAPQPRSRGCHVLLQAVLQPQQPWVLKEKPFWGQKGFDPGHTKHFILLFHLQDFHFLQTRH